MTLNNKLTITTDDFSIFRRPDLSPVRKLRFQYASGFGSTFVRTIVSIAMVLFLGQPLFAQQTVPAEATNAAVASAGSQPNGAGMLPEVPRPSSDAGTTANGAAALSSQGTIFGTVLDVNGDLVPGATVELTGSSSDDRREVTSDDSAAFKFESVKPGVPYELSIHLKGFSPWTSSSIVLQPAQFLIVSDIHLKLEADVTSVTVYGSTEDIAVEQVNLQEQQRVLGFIPNFYVNYDAANAAPLTTKLKFKLALRVARDPVTLLGVAFMSGIDQASSRPNYVLGAKGYGQRFGANAAGGFSDILLGGAVLPSLLHQDPRYFYQGTGGTRSRMEHAMVSPFVCRGDNGQRQINFSSIGGDIGATALSMTYYPESNRGAGDVFVAFGISEAERVLSAIAQEFILPRFTPSFRKSK
jgi:hypothetical protein